MLARIPAAFHHRRHAGLAVTVARIAAIDRAA